MRLRYAVTLAAAAFAGIDASAQTPLIFERDFREDAAALEMGPVRVVPALRTIAGHDDNIFESAEREVSSTFVNVTSEVSAALAYDRSTLLVGYQADYFNFENSSDDNITDQLFFLRGTTEGGLRHRLTLDLAHVMDHEARGTGLTEGFDPLLTLPSSPDRFTDDRARLRYEFGARRSAGTLRVDLGWLDRSYQNHRERTRFFDRSVAAAGATFLWRVMPRTSLALEARAREIEYDESPLGQSSRDSTEYDLLAGAEWEFSEATSGRFRIGEKTKDFDARDRRDSDNIGWEFSASWAPRSYSVFDLSLQRSPEETNAAGDFIDSKRYSLGWRHQWLERVHTDVVASRDDRSYQEAARDQKVDALHIELGYEMRRWLTLSLAGEWRERSSDFDPLEFSRNRYWLAVELHL
jgi:hypothetical protein